MGEAGSVHDACVYCRSSLYNKASTGEGFPENSHILGDGAYPLQEHLLIPYRDNGNLNSIQILYNKVHSKCRNVIERAFSHLVGRFRRLKHLDMCRMDLIVKSIMGACILHNLCIVNSDLIEEMDDYHQNEAEQLIVQSAYEKRQAVIKRDAIANLIYQKRYELYIAKNCTYIFYYY